MIYIVWLYFILNILTLGLNIGRLGQPKEEGVYGLLEIWISLAISALLGFALYLHYHP